MPPSRQPPSSAELLQQAVQQHRQGNLRQAEAGYQQVLRVAPQDAMAWYYLGSVQQSLGRHEEAVASLRQALSLQPDQSNVLNNLGVALAQIEQFDEAMNCLEQATRLRPEWVEPLRNLATMLSERGRLDEAAGCYRRIVTLTPLDAEIHSLLGGVLARTGEIAAALACFEESLRLEPRHQRAHSNLLLALNYDELREPEWLQAEHSFWNRLHGRGPGQRAARVRDPQPDRPLRIGYVSPDLRTHAVAQFLEPILAHHNPSRFEVFAYAEVNAPDDTSHRMKSHLQGWHSTIARSDQQLAEQIQSDGIDILVDLAGHSGRNRLGLFTHKPAPVQVTYLGYPNTTGLDAINYRLTDAVADPPGEPRRHSEELVRLPGCFCCWQPPEGAPDINPAPAVKNGYITFGSLHNLAKLNPRVLELWSRILHAVPTSRLVVFRNSLRGQTAERLRSQLRSLGLGEERFDLRCDAEPGQGYLNVYHDVDVLLDTFPWSGHATTCESLWMGVPTITLRGQRHAGRMAASILTCVGLSNWITETPEHYLRCAIQAAEDTESVTTLRAELRDRVRTSPLCDYARFTAHLEQTYREMWRRSIAIGQ